jgi:dCMP deaminase
MRNQETWDRRYIDMAELVASWSKDPSTKCGAVIVNEDNEIVSIGFNGFPKGVADLQSRLYNRDLKYAITIHAERNAILFAKQSLKNCTLYTFPMQCCSECAAMAIQSGIKRHVSLSYQPERWQKSFELAKEMFKEANVSTTYYHLVNNHESN